MGLQLLVVAMGGACGALARYGLTDLISISIGRDFPYATWVVNLFGSLLIGVLYALLIERMAADAEWRGLLMVGLLGAFTTFSTFSLETILLMEQTAYFKAVINVLMNLVFCLGATAFGLMLGRSIPLN
jgi:CrcB protein